MSKDFFEILRRRPKKTLEEKKEAKRIYMRERYHRMKNDPNRSQIEKEKEKIKYNRRKQRRQANMKYKKYMEQMGYRLQWEDPSRGRKQRNLLPDEIVVGKDFPII